MTGQFCFAESAVKTSSDAGEADQKFMRTVDVDKVSVSSTRANENTPIAHTDMNKEEIRGRNIGQDLAFILTSTPSVVATSDAGAGIGYTGIRIRGADATRINVTLNGIPMNDAESHGLFWVNTPDIAASLEDIQIQRGVGTSTNGAGSFGGSINMRSELLGSDPFLSVSGTYGSYRTHRQSINLGTGFIGDSKWAFNTRLSNIASDGYLDRASTKLKSYFFQAGYFGKTTTLRFINFGGTEETYHAWSGVTQDDIDKHGRRYNPSGVIEDENGNEIGFYKDQTDNYDQSNYQILLNQYITRDLSLNVGLHYTDGDGYYEEYKNRRTLEEYGLRPFTDPSGNLVTKSNLVRRKMMDNWFGGGVFSLDYVSSRLNASLGGGVNKYDGDHFGKVTWIQNYAGDPTFQPDHEYYRNNGTKLDYNVYLRADWYATKRLSLYGDVQYRYINYKIDGANDNWDFNNGHMQLLEIDEHFNFFNPKAGANFLINDNFKVYGSVAVAHKEPTRNNYTDADLSKMPKPERLIDFEAGAKFRNSLFSAGVNFYYMDYKDQLVLTGKVNHIGEPLSENVKDSYRAGIELTTGIKPTQWLTWDLNATFSRNRIKGYVEYLDNVDAGLDPLYTPQTLNYVGNTDIGFSPNVMAGSLLTATYKGARVALQSNYVGKQYLSNAGQKDIRLDDYFVSNLRMDYTFSVRSVKSINVGVTINNLLDEKYASNGFAWSANVVQASGGSCRADVPYYFPQARTNVLGHVTINF